MTTTHRPKAGRPTRDQARARHVAMLETALDHFLNLGFEQTTIESIARSVGMTKRTIYARYPDKVALFHAAVGLAIDRFAVSQEQIEATERGDIEQTLIAFAWLRIEQVMTPNGLKLQRIINTEAYRFPQILAESYEIGAGPSVRFLASLLARETAAGRLSVQQPERAAVVFLSMVVSGPVRTIVIGNQLSRDEIEDRLRYAVRLFLDGARSRLVELRYRSQRFPRLRSADWDSSDTRMIQRSTMMGDRAVTQTSIRSVSTARRHIRKRSLGLLGIALAAVLALGACSSSSSSPGGGSTTSAAASATAPASAATGGSTAAAAAGSDIGLTATTIRIGVIADVNTAVNPGLFQKNVNMVKAWAAIVNAKGGLAGRQVQVDFCDSKLDPNATSNCMIQACSQDFALVGTAALALLSPSAIDSCKNSSGQATGIPNLEGITQTASVQCDADTFMIGGNDPTLCATSKDNPQTYTVPVGDDKWLAKQHPGLHGIFVYNTDSPTAKLNELPVYNADVAQAGIKLDGLGYYGSSCTQPQSALIPTVLVMKQHGSTFAQDGSCPGNFEQLQAEAKVQGVTGVTWMCAGGCYAPYYIALNPSVTEGTYQNLTSIAFYTEYQDNPTLAAEVKQLGGINNVDSNALASYVEALLFQDAVTKAAATGTLNRQTLFTALNTQETAFNANGIVGATNVSKHELSPCFAIAQVVNGKWQRVYPAQATAFDCNPSNLVQIKANPSGSS